MNKNTSKIVVVLICLVAAGALIAWNMGWIGGGGPAGPPTAGGATPVTGATDAAADKDAVKQGGAATAGQLKKDNF